MKYEGKPVKVAIGQQHQVELPPRVFRARLTGMLFETDKTFLLPSAMRGIRGIVDYYDQHPNMNVLVNGHTDRVGSDQYNLGLSVERAESIKHYLTDNVDEWMKWYAGRPNSRPWGVREDQHMMSAILDDKTGDFFYRGPITGQNDAATRDAYTRYQNARGLSASGSPDDATRRSLVKDYMALDGTTLPASASVELHGCGEYHNAVPTADGVDEPANRRVEVFLFDGGPVDPPARTPCPGPNGCPEYPEWCKRTVETVDFDHDLGEINVMVVRDVAGDPKPPVPSAKVTVKQGGADVKSGLCDDNGCVRFANMATGTYQLVADKDGFEQGKGEVTVQPGGQASGNSSAKSLAGEGDQTGTPPTVIPVRPTGLVRLVPLDELVAPYSEGAPLVGATIGLMLHAGSALIALQNPFDPVPTTTRESGEMDKKETTQPWRGARVDTVAPNDQIDVSVGLPGRSFKSKEIVIPAKVDAKHEERVTVQLESNDPPYTTARLAANEAALRQRIVALALSEAAIWEANWDAVFAKKGVSNDLNHPSWMLLNDYFRVIWDGINKSMKNPDVKWPFRGNSAAEHTAWCGIFATWCVRTAADPGLFWVMNSGPHRGDPSSARLPDVKDLDKLQAGDICFFGGDDMHHGLCVGVDGDTITTVEGNFSDPDAYPDTTNSKVDHHNAPAVQKWHRAKKAVISFYKWP